MTAAPTVEKFQRRPCTVALILHHTETSRMATLEGIRRGHMKDNGWTDIGYHYVIRQESSGRPVEVLKGRPEYARGAHAYSKAVERGWNTISIGIALVGTFFKDPPPAPMLTACETLCRALLARYPGVVDLLGHREAMARIGDPGHTDCPGDNWVQEIRRRLKVKAQPTTGPDLLYREDPPDVGPNELYFG